MATGQTINVTADAVAGATTLVIAPLPVPLLAGAVLTFLEAGLLMPAQVSIQAPANVGAVSLSIAPLVQLIPTGAQARDSGVNAATGARLVVSTRKGTSKVKLYCNARYDDAQLKLCGSVCDWSVVCAARFLCMRRAQGCPKGIASEYEEVLEELRMVQSGALSLEDIGTRGVDWPTITNIGVRPGYNGMQARVEPGISEQTPTAYGQFVDWNSAAYVF